MVGSPWVPWATWRPKMSRTIPHKGLFSCFEDFWLIKRKLENWLPLKAKISAVLKECCIFLFLCMNISLKIIGLRPWNKTSNNCYSCYTTLKWPPKLPFLANISKIWGNFSKKKIPALDLFGATKLILQPIGVTPFLAARPCFRFPYIFWFCLQTYIAPNAHVSARQALGHFFCHASVVNWSLVRCAASCGLHTFCLLFCPFYI